MDTPIMILKDILRYINEKDEYNFDNCSDFERLYQIKSAWYDIIERIEKVIDKNDQSNQEVFEFLQEIANSCVVLLNFEKEFVNLLFDVVGKIKDKDSKLYSELADSILSKETVREIILSKINQSLSNLLDFIREN